MINQQIIDFIKGQLSKGLTREKITSDLLASGWTTQDIEEGFRVIATPAPSISNASNSLITPVQTKTHSNRKIFIYLGFFMLFLSLYLFVLTCTQFFYYSPFIIPIGIVVIAYILCFIISMVLFMVSSYLKEKDKGTTTKLALSKSLKFVYITLLVIIIGVLFVLFAIGAGRNGLS